MQLQEMTEQITRFKADVAALRSKWEYKAQPASGNERIWSLRVDDNLDESGEPFTNKPLGAIDEQVVMSV